jgi:DNA primase
VVEGYTDVMALRQRALEPVVASMGTALTQQQLRELGRLTRRLYLCFDADAAGESATLRGMELAADQGLEVRVVPLPAGLDPADVADRFDDLLGRAESYVGYRVRLEIERAADRQEGFVRVREVLGRFEDSPERQEALRHAADKLGLPKETQAGLAPRTRASTGTLSPRVLEAAERLERDALAGCLAHPKAKRILAEIGPEYFDSDLHRRLREHLLEPEPAPDADLVALLAELDARAAREGIDEETAKQLLLRLRERWLRRELESADDTRLASLQHALAEVRTRIREFA